MINISVNKIYYVLCYGFFILEAEKIVFSGQVSQLVILIMLSSIS